MKPPLERNVKMQIPPCSAESPRFPNVSISQRTAGPFQPSRSWELPQHPGETFLPRPPHPPSAPKGANFPQQDPAGPIPRGSLPAGTWGSSSPRWGTVRPGAEGYFYCCVYCLLNEPPGGVGAFQRRGRDLEQPGLLCKVLKVCARGRGRWKFPLGLACGPEHPSHPLEHASVLLHLFC